jgi:hypothetical protein
MPLSRSFKTTIKARAEHDAAYRAAIFQEGVESLLKGDVEVAKSAIRVYINATVGFDAPAKRTGTPSKSLMRLFGPRGNPTVRNLSTIPQQLQRNSGGQPVRTVVAGEEAGRTGTILFTATAKAVLFLICSVRSVRISTHRQESAPT